MGGCLSNGRAHVHHGSYNLYAATHTGNGAWGIGNQYHKLHSYGKERGNNHYHHRH